jgi:hypothetical protein
MKKKDSSPLVIKIIGIIITAWIAFLVTFELIKALKRNAIESFFYDTSNIYTDPNTLILIYLVGYAIVWWKKLWGTVIIIIVSILGIIVSQAGDVQFHFMLTQFHFMLTFLVGILYFLYWNDERKKKKKLNNV